MRYEDGSSNTTTANTWRVITQKHRFIARIWPTTFGRISRCSGKSCKSSRHTLTLADIVPRGGERRPGRLGETTALSLFLALSRARSVLSDIVATRLHAGS